MSPFEALVIKFMQISLRYMWASMLLSKHPNGLSYNLTEFVGSVETEIIDFYTRVKKL